MTIITDIENDECLDWWDASFDTEEYIIDDFNTTIKEEFKTASERMKRERYKRAMGVV